MKLKQLIEILQNLDDPEADVLVEETYTDDLKPVDNVIYNAANRTVRFE